MPEVVTDGQDVSSFIDPRARRVPKPMHLPSGVEHTGPFAQRPDSFLDIADFPGTDNLRAHAWCVGQPTGQGLMQTAAERHGLPLLPLAYHDQVGRFAFQMDVDPLESSNFADAQPRVGTQQQNDLFFWIARLQE